MNNSPANTTTRYVVDRYAFIALNTAIGTQVIQISSIRILFERKE